MARISPFRWFRSTSRKSFTHTPSSRTCGSATGNGAEQQLEMFNDFNGVEDLAAQAGVLPARPTLVEPANPRGLAAGHGLVSGEGRAPRPRCSASIWIHPYGVKFNSNWQVSTRKRDVRDGRVEDATRQPEQVRAYRDTWKLGVHSYLTYLRDRLIVARELLKRFRAASLFRSAKRMFTGCISVSPRRGFWIPELCRQTLVHERKAVRH